MLRKSTMAIANTSARTSEVTRKADLTNQSALYGGIVGELTGAVLGTITGSFAGTLTGVLMGFTIGVLLGAFSGFMIGLIVNFTAGTKGGPSIGAYTGMGSGALLGGAFGMLIPEAWRMSANTLHTPILNALTSSRFETVVLLSFLVCILGMIVGVWVSAKSYAPERSK